ncbi:D-glycerate 3-kinase-like protein [Zopfia rhizophila CBS 207.26]|uniref:D-glycerate 3-kinase-like protein n=1 Tax=Zopfia rhizophila CBS 207.26 TaxID=1314779 RepID=A0A6A6E4N4_9PEZI|nr:D-glycerate 3-kinase-like protein [Zopfia rhizophila CBS 207.26]
MSLESNIKRVLDILLPKIKSEKELVTRPIILGITGLQGSGKSTWASKIVELLSNSYDLGAITISLDDLYKTHDELIAQRDKNPENKLYRTRGQPGTHDELLAARFFKELKNWKGDGELRIPSFDKSKFNGEGDRAPQSEWPTISGNINVVVFEGWCVGFQPLPEFGLEENFQEAAKAKEPKDVKESTNTLADHCLGHLMEVNQNLKRYYDTFMGPQHVDFLIHIDTDDLRNVYRWRLEQEHKLRETKGTGMSDEEVIEFVRGYMPAYELYLDGLRDGFFGSKDERQIRVVLDRDRKVEKVEVI